MKQELIKHKSVHRKKSFKCEACDFVSESKDTLKNHIDDAHDSIDVVLENDSTENNKQRKKVVYQCHECNFQTEQKDNLKDHFNSQHSPKITLGSFKCKHCDYIGVKKDSLEQHVRMKHDQSQTNRGTNYICEFCDYETVSEINLKSHEKEVHMRTKSRLSSDENKKASGPIYKENTRSNFPCDVCNFSAGSDQELNRHLESMQRFARVSRQRSPYTQEERKQNGLCFHWNNGDCRFQELCRFAHEEIPQCHFDGRCRRENCHFFHSQPKTPSPAPFLSRRGLQRKPLHSQRRQPGGGQRR